MISLIHVGRPKALHIMALAMSSRALEARWWYSRIGDGLSRVAGGQASRWIVAHQGASDIRLIGTRNYVPQQTGFYAYWLLFQESNLPMSFCKHSRVSTPQNVSKDLAVIAMSWRRKSMNVCEEVVSTSENFPPNSDVQ